MSVERSNDAEEQVIHKGIHRILYLNSDIYNILWMSNLYY